VAYIIVGGMIFLVGIIIGATLVLLHLADKEEKRIEEKRETKNGRWW
jgi:hypothetical protein